MNRPARRRVQSPDPAPLLPDRWEFYVDRFAQWQWRKFEDRKVVAVSGDGFSSRRDCVANACSRGYDGS